MSSRCAAWHDPFTAVPILRNWLLLTGEGDSITDLSGAVARSNPRLCVDGCGSDTSLGESTMRKLLMLAVAGFSSRDSRS